MKTLGILGGVGPQTTSKVYLSIVNSTREQNSDHYPPIIIYNMPFPFIIEDEAIIRGVNAEKMIPYLIEGAKILEKAGADFGILPCNTLHKYIEEIRASVKLPFLSILEETASVLKNRKINNVGILGTETTVNSKIYEVSLNQNGINILYPFGNEQKKINKIILEILRGEETNLHKEKLGLICGSLHERGADAILLACTDLQLIASDLKTTIPIIDSTEILINSSVREMQK